MHPLLLLALLLCATLAGCSDDDSGTRIGDDRGGCLARQLSQHPPEESEGQLDPDDAAEACRDGAHRGA